MNGPANANARAATSARLLAVSAALLLVVWIAAALQLGRDRAAVLDATVTAQGNMALSLERDIVRNIDIIDLSLRSTAAGIRLVDDTQTPEVRQAILFDGAAAAPYLRPIVIADAAGVVQHDGAAAEPRFPSLAQREYFKRHSRERKLGLLAMFSSSQTTRAPFLSLSRRLECLNGTFSGIVASGLDLDYFRSIFSHFELASGGAIALLGYDGTLIAGFPFREDKAGADLSQSDLVRQARGMESGSFETTSVVDGIERVATVRKLGELPFFIAVGTPTEAVYAQWWRRAAVTLASLLVFSAATAALVFALRRELRGRREAEQAARAGERRLETYLCHLADGVLAIKRREDGCFVYERINAAAASMLRLPADDAVGKRPQELLPEDTARFVESKWAEAANGADPIRYERVHEWPEGRQVLRFVISAVRNATSDAAGDVELLLVGVRDVTATVDMEARLRQAQRMEVVGQLTAGVAHDFNNMLQVQFGALEMLLSELGDREDEREYAEMTLAAARHGARLTHSLLAFSRQQTLAPTAIDVDAMLRTVSGMLAHTIGPRVDIVVPRRKRAGRPFADANQLEAALLNLALNGRDAMPAGGRLVLTACDGTEAASIPGGIDPAGHFLLAVDDEGEGMSAETAAKACEPFFTTKAVGKGSGLGLSMVSGFVQQSGGTMRIVSRPGEGTRVELWLPRAGSENPGGLVKRPPSKHDPLPPGRILLVDDLPEVLAVTAEMLESHGFEVVQANGGGEALALLASEAPFDALVTDFMMPGLDGRELIHAARGLAMDFAALVVTGYAELDETGLPPEVRVVRKPVGGQELAGLVAEAIRERRPPGGVGVRPDPSSAADANGGPRAVGDGPRLRAAAFVGDEG